MKKGYPLTLTAIAIALLSWSHLKDTKTASSVFSATNERNDLRSTDDETLAILDDSSYQYSPNEKQVPPAEDVLVQKVPGDKNHLLLMAFYSKENYSGQSLTLMDGSGIVLRDDG